MATKKKLDWLTASTVKDENSFIGKWHLYTDVNFDLRQSEQITVDKNKIMSSITTRGRDIDVLHDEACIIHSIYELFNTKRGSRVLVPDYGCGLWEHIGNHITELECESIQYDLTTAINKWEPRVTVLGIQVTAMEDDSTVDIKLAVKIPEITKTVTQGFQFNASIGLLTMA